MNGKGRLLKIALSVPTPYLVKEFTSFFIFMALGIQRRLVITGPLATACLKLFILNKKVSNLLCFGSKKIHFSSWEINVFFHYSWSALPVEFYKLEKIISNLKKMNFEEKKLIFLAHFITPGVLKYKYTWHSACQPKISGMIFLWLSLF